MLFNSVVIGLMVHPKFHDAVPDMFICGNDESAKKTVSEICKQLGWPSLDFGTIEMSRALEELCMLWVGFGAKYGTWNHAFKLVQK
jgi:predicted dinucleotide-binding enzyme